METNIRKLESDLRYESRKFTVQAIVVQVPAAPATHPYPARTP